MDLRSGRPGRLREAGEQRVLGSPGGDGTTGTGQLVGQGGLLWRDEWTRLPLAGPGVQVTAWGEELPDCRKRVDELA